MRRSRPIVRSRMLIITTAVLVLHLWIGLYLSVAGQKHRSDVLGLPRVHGEGLDARHVHPQSAVPPRALQAHQRAVGH